MNNAYVERVINMNNNKKALKLIDDLETRLVYATSDDILFLIQSIDILTSTFMVKSTEEEQTEAITEVEIILSRLGVKL